MQIAISCYRENFSGKIQIIMALSVPDKAKVNVKRYTLNYVTQIY